MPVLWRYNVRNKLTLTLKHRFQLRWICAFCWTAPAAQILYILWNRFLCVRRTVCILGDWLIKPWRKVGYTGSICASHLGGFVSPFSVWFAPLKRNTFDSICATLKIETLPFKRIVGVAHFLNPKIRGWINYYGMFRKSELNKVFQLLRKRLVRWARMRYKRYKTRLNKACEWLERIRKQYPTLFRHWEVGFSC